MRKPAIIKNNRKAEVAEKEGLGFHPGLVVWLLPAACLW